VLERLDRSEIVLIVAVAFFTLTASNFIGESEMSNMAWVPSMVSSNRLYIERTD